MYKTEQAFDKQFKFGKGPLTEVNKLSKIGQEVLYCSVERGAVKSYLVMASVKRQKGLHFEPSIVCLEEELGEG